MDHTSEPFRFGGLKKYTNHVTRVMEAKAGCNIRASVSQHFTSFHGWVTHH